MGTFHGIEMAKQALFTQQSALYTSGHNIANANTEGYSRQRVNFETTTPYPSASRNRPQIPGQMGTGVEAGSVERIRDKFLDTQFRTENSKAGFWETTSDAMSRMENILNEPSENGLANTMDKFWESLQDLSVNPENSGARSVVVQRGIAVSETFNYLHDTLTSVQSDLQNEIGVTVEDANSLIRQIHGINEQISGLEPHGYLANDLYDERDRLVDELSSIVNIKVTYNQSGDSSPEIADGLVNIELANDNGQSNGITLVDGEQGNLNFNEFNFSNEDSFSIDGDKKIQEITIGEENFPLSSANGSLSGLLNAHGFEDNEENTFNFQTVLDDLNKMAKAFAGEFNNVHKSGHDLTDEDKEVSFFANINSAGEIKVADAIQNNPDLIAASGNGSPGDGSNAIELAKVYNKVLNSDLGENTSTKTHYESLIGRLGVRAQEANRMANNTGVLRQQVEEQRQSVSSVSLDEEMSNMIKFQHAYNAAARSMTTMDELLDRVINNLGLVGR